MSVDSRRIISEEQQIALDILEKFGYIDQGHGFYKKYADGLECSIRKYYGDPHYYSLQIRYKDELILAINDPILFYIKHAILEIKKSCEDGDIYTRCGNVPKRYRETILDALYFLEYLLLR